MTGRATHHSAVSFGVLGPLEAADDHGPLALGGPRHREVLARLLIARGSVVPLDQLVQDLWHTPAPGAVASVRTFVAALRRSLEPDRPARQPARLLVTSPPGYALRAAPRAVDAQRFEEATEHGGALLARHQPRSALTELERALALWRGPAYAEFDHHTWARTETERLGELRLITTERHAQALLDLGRAEDAVPALRAHTREHPLRESAWHHLALALYRCGQQGEALTALGQARVVLARELGVDPGPKLRRLHADILAQAPHLTPRQHATATDAAPERHGLVGRDRELRAVEEAATQTAPHTSAHTALICGDAGAGKTALADALTRRLRSRGWTTAWGRAPEHEGAPEDWPWHQIATALTDRTGPPAPPAAAADPATGRFQALREAVGLLAAASEQGPVLLVFDDLHRAGEQTLDLFTALTAPALPGPVLVVGTHRTGEVTPALRACLARIAPREPTRVYLGGLDAQATGELASSLLGHHPHARDLRTIHQRSGGNPFFARELTRLLAAEGPTALEAVPDGVRDVLRHRLATLPPSSQRLLRQAAVIGRDVDPQVLAALYGEGEELLDAVDAALRAGLLTEHDGDRPLRFAHVLVRDTLYQDLSPLHRTRWHTAAAQAIHALRPDDDAALAHHFARAATRATAARAAHHARAAAMRAEEGFAPHEASRWWREAVTAHERLGADHSRGHLEAVMGMVRALAVTGHLHEARHQRAAAVSGAEKLGEPELTARVITAFDVPALWTRGDDDTIDRHIADAAERTLAALPPGHREARARLLATLALELRATDDPRGPRAARQAEGAARDLGDPALLALALNARFMHSFDGAGQAPHRVRIGTELVELAGGHNLVTFEVLGHLILMQAHCALGDMVSADTHAREAGQLGERYEIPLVGVFTSWYAALRATVADQPAEAAYRTASTRLTGAGMHGLEQGILPLALLCLRLQHGERVSVDLGQDWGPYAPWARALADPRTNPPPPEAPPGLLQEALTCLAARAAAVVGDRPAMERAHDALLPAAEEVAGAGSGLLALGPVAQHLGDLARALDRPAQAAAHYRQAARVATRAGAAHWLAAARAAMDALS